MNTNILRFNGSVEISPEDVATLQMGTDIEVRLIGEVRAIVNVATDNEDKKMVYRLRVSEVKYLGGMIEGNEIAHQEGAGQIMGTL